MTLNSVKKRLEKLEQKTGEEEEQHVVIFVTVSADEIENKSCSGYIMDCVEKACSDKDIVQRLLEQAFIDVTGRNPFDTKNNVIIISISADVANRVVELLREQGISVDI